MIGLFLNLSLWLQRKQKSIKKQNNTAIPEFINDMFLTFKKLKQKKMFFMLNSFGIRITNFRV